MIVLMGSGETSPTMVELHKSLLGKRGTVTILDTPYGFQENADELTAKAVAYFRDSVGVETEVVSLRSAELPAHEVGAALARLTEADYVFCGPGSPTYALRQFRAVGMADILAGVVRRGGTVCLASAASVTTGAMSIPVYEIYKVGLTPYWEEGADLLGRLGIRAAVVPHFDNAEGGTHDTSCCWIGRSRLDALRQQVPDLPVLGIDEHTAVVIDASTAKASVHGLSQAHVLVGDRAEHHASGTTFDLARSLTGDALEVPETTATVPSGLAAAVAARSAQQVVAALVDALDADVLLATTLAELTPVLARGWAELPVELLLTAREQAREHKQWAISDLLRDGLATLGVMVEDTPQGQRVERRSVSLNS